MPDLLEQSCTCLLPWLSLYVLEVLKSEPNLLVSFQPVHPSQQNGSSNLMCEIIVMIVWIHWEWQDKKITVHQTQYFLNPQMAWHLRVANIRLMLQDIGNNAFQHKTVPSKKLTHLSKAKDKPLQIFDKKTEQFQQLLLPPCLGPKVPFLAQALY